LQEADNKEGRIFPGVQPTSDIRLVEKIKEKIFFKKEKKGKKNLVVCTQLVSEPANGLCCHPGRPSSFQTSRPSWPTE
jgi:hypothetical protein